MTEPARRRICLGCYQLAALLIVKTGGYTHEDRSGIPVIDTIWQVRTNRGPVADCRTLAQATRTARQYIAQEAK